MLTLSRTLSVEKVEGDRNGNGHTWFERKVQIVTVDPTGEKPCTVEVIRVGTHSVSLSEADDGF
jgi:hypothetical protein